MGGKRFGAGNNKRKGLICLGWPTPSWYWNDSHVKEFLNTCEMTKIQPHGFACGLKTSKGRYMNKKPWSVASSSDVIAEGLIRRCDGSHRHVGARGRDCNPAEEYSDEFARRVRVLVLQALVDGWGM
eukprot:368477-Pyramimonas_sp.AAC.1